jgi:hypothetical protein
MGSSRSMTGPPLSGSPRAGPAIARNLIGCQFVREP